MGGAPQLLAGRVGEKGEAMPRGGGATEPRPARGVPPRPPYSQHIMTAEEYLLNRLHSLGQKPDGAGGPRQEGLVDFIYRTVVSKKFRKYSVSPEYQRHIRSAIQLNVRRGEPIKLTIIFGGYKLWRLEEAPEPDWAELFSMMYYAAWLKPISDYYEPGVWFDFYSDDVIVERIDNISKQETGRYNEVFLRLLIFLQRYLPANLRLTLNRVGDQYSSPAEFEADLAQQVEALQHRLGGLPQLTPADVAVLDLNVRLKPGQADDPQWQAKVKLVHDAYMLVLRRRPYYRVPDKIVVITRAAQNSIAVGTTKSSVAKFWAGVGVLARIEDTFAETVLSPSQIEKTRFDWYPMGVAGLEGKNFMRLRIIS